MGTSGISSPFELLSRSSGQVAYVLLDRSPLGSEPKLLPPLDLHVAGTPLAFALSQDQTLHRKSIPLPNRVGICDGVKSSPGIRPQGFCPLPSFQGAAVLSFADNNIHHTCAICQRFPQGFLRNFFGNAREPAPHFATQYYTTVFPQFAGFYRKNSPATHPTKSNRHPFTTPMGRIRATLREMPTPSHTSTTLATSL